MKPFAALLLAVVILFAGLLGLYAVQARAGAQPKLLTAAAPAADRTWDAAVRAAVSLGGAFLSTFQSWQKVFNQNARRVAANVLQYRLEGIEGAYRVPVEDIRAAAGLEQGRSVWQAMPAEIGAAVETLPWIERAAVDWALFPLRLQLSVDEAEPWLVAEFGGHSWLISRKFALIVPLHELRDSELVLEASRLPRLAGLESEQGFSSYLSSENARLLYAAKMIAFLEMGESLPFEAARYELQTDGSLLVSPADIPRLPLVRLTAHSYEDAAQAGKRLRNVLADLSSRGELVQEIDLRFADQAVVR